MRAQFKVTRSFLLPERSLFVLAGTITQGLIQPGMLALIPLNRSTSLPLEIAGVEFIKTNTSEEVGLTVRYDDPDEGGLLEALNISDEYLIIR